MFLHFEITYDVFSGDIHKLPNGLPQLPNAFSQRVEVQIAWWIALLCPASETLAISYCEKCGLLPYALVSEVIQEVGPSIQASGGRRHGISFFWEHPRLDFWYIK